MDVHEVLVKARNLIDREGHAKLTTGDSLRGRCIQGALGDAVGGDKWDRYCAPLVVEAVRQMGFAHICAACSWNNAEERTKEEVLARFDNPIASTAPAPQDPFEADPLRVEEEAEADAAAV
jgi:hypothetical protein